jgi:N-acetylglucosaminylphosphatidylinositol deacetylase
MSDYSFYAIIVWSVLVFQLTTVIVYIFLIRKRRYPTRNPDKTNVYCILIAHPDDECLFFGPTIRYLVKNSNKVYLLCLTNGNYYGLGHVRESELESSCKYLNIELIRKYSFKFDDQPHEKWNLIDCTKHIAHCLANYKITNLITFDKHGISSHINHRNLNDCLKAVQNQNLTIHTLDTVCLARKYLFVFDLLWSLAIDHKKILIINKPIDYWILIQAMKAHKTQFVWFRYMYIIASRYMLFNNLDLYT